MSSVELKALARDICQQLNKDDMFSLQIVQRLIQKSLEDIIKKKIAGIQLQLIEAEADMANMREYLRILSKER